MKITVLILLVIAATSLACKSGTKTTPGEETSTDSPTGDSSSPHTSTETTISIDWKDIETGGTGIVGYYIVYLVGDTAPMNCDSPDRITSSSAEDTTAVISGLQAGTQYTFRICSFDNEGNVYTNDASTFTIFTQPAGTDPEGTQSIAALSSPSQAVISIHSYSHQLTPHSDLLKNKPIH